MSKQGSPGCLPKGSHRPILLLSHGQKGLIAGIAGSQRGAHVQRSAAEGGRQSCLDGRNARAAAQQLDRCQVVWCQIVPLQHLCCRCCCTPEKVSSQVLKSLPAGIQSVAETTSQYTSPWYALTSCCCIQASGVRGNAACSEHPRLTSSQMTCNSGCCMAIWVKVVTPGDTAAEIDSIQDLLDIEGSVRIGTQNLLGALYLQRVLCVSICSLIHKFQPILPGCCACSKAPTKTDRSYTHSEHTPAAGMNEVGALVHERSCTKAGCRSGAT